MGASIRRPSRFFRSFTGHNESTALTSTASLLLKRASNGRFLAISLALRRLLDTTLKSIAILPFIALALRLWVIYGMIFVYLKVARNALTIVGIRADR